MQIIICVESNKQNKSDWMYIKSTIDSCFVYDRSLVKLSPVYMSGKGNYNSNKIQKRISTLKKEYAAGSKCSSESVVIYAIDCDECFKDSADMSFLNLVEKYCKDNGYDFVWFFRDVEEVYVKKRVDVADKKRTAEQFFRLKKIKKLDKDRLKSAEMNIGRSNIMLVLEKYLEPIV